jgi:hypothetical protein
MKRIAAIGIVLLVAGSTAHAQELELSGSGGGAASSRAGDGAILSSGRVALRFNERLAVSVFGHAGYAAGPAPVIPLQDMAVLPLPDRRVLTALGVDGRVSFPLGRLRPFARLGVVHQHERGWRAFADDPLGTLLGTADDARRRTGGSVGGGSAVVIWRAMGAEVFATAEVWALAFADDRAPRAYVGATAGLGLAFDLDR